MLMNDDEENAFDNFIDSDEAERIFADFQSNLKIAFHKGYLKGKREEQPE